MAKTKSGAYGVGQSDEEPILDPAVYRDAFERIDKEMFTRIALSAPKPTAPVVIVPIPNPTPASAPTSPITN